MSRSRSTVDDPPLPEPVKRRGGLAVMKSSDIKLPEAAPVEQWQPAKVGSDEAKAQAQRLKDAEKEARALVAAEEEAKAALVRQAAQRKEATRYAIVGAASVFVVAMVIAAATFQQHREHGPYSSRIFSTRELAAMGVAWRERSLASWGGAHASQPLQAHVTAIGASVASQRPMRFLVVNEPRVVHAFGLVDDTVVITVGMLRRLKSDAELAAVLAHVVAHERLGQSQRRLDAYVNKGGDAVLIPAQKGVDKPADSDTLAMLATLGSTVPHDVEEEVVADDDTRALLNAAGYDVSALKRALTIRMLGSEAFLIAHPIDALRRQRFAELVSSGREDQTSYETNVLANLRPPSAITAPKTETLTNTLKSGDATQAEPAPSTTKKPHVSKKPTKQKGAQPKPKRPSK